MSYIMSKGLGVTKFYNVLSVVSTSFGLSGFKLVDRSRLHWLALTK